MSWNAQAAAMAERGVHESPALPIFADLRCGVKPVTPK